MQTPVQIWEPERPAAMFPDRVRLPLSFDAAGLQRDLERVRGSGWIGHFVTQNFDGDWSVIPLRGPAGATHPVAMIYPNPTAERFEDSPLLDRTPAFRQVLQSFECPLQCVRLMRLTPGSRIKVHQDHDLAFELGAVRIHVPIATSPEVEFLLNGTPASMAPGSAWYLRLSDPHSCENRSSAERVHLVIDAVADAWLERLLRAGETLGASGPPETAADRRQVCSEVRQ